MALAVGFGATLVSCSLLAPSDQELGGGYGKDAGAADGASTDGRVGDAPGLDAFRDALSDQSTCAPDGGHCGVNGDCCEGVCMGGTTCGPCVAIGGGCQAQECCQSAVCQASTCQACAGNGQNCAVTPCCPGLGCKGNNICR